MSFVDIGIAVAAFSAVGAAVYSIWRNGRRASKDYGSLEQKVDGIKGSLDNPDTGLSAINRELSDMKVHCAGVTGSFGQKIKGLEAEVFEGKRQRSKRDSA